MTKKIPNYFEEEKDQTKKYIGQLKGLSEKEMKESCFLRDLSISVLESGDSSEVLSNLSKLGIKVSEKDLKDSLDLWQGDTSVQAFRTPKLLLYTIRGDYSVEGLLSFLES